jgi:branched-chain amino acid transport system ATP-binding protein
VIDLTVRIGGRVVLGGLSFHAQEHRVNLVVGQNGSGKSTLLRALAGVIAPNEGRVIYKGRDITGQARRARLLDGIVYVRQKDNVYLDLSVIDNLKTSSRSAKRGPDFGRMLDMVGEIFPILKARQSSPAHQMSTGERQQLAIAMGLVQCPEVLLIDEPTSGLAPAVAEKVLRSIAEAGSTLRLTTILVEQNVHGAAQLATRGYLLSGGVLRPFSLDAVPQVCKSVNV